MDYLHIAQLDTIKAFSPLDTLFAAEVAHVLDKLGQNIENLGTQYVAITHLIGS
jgi:hypothetical protein